MSSGKSLAGNKEGRAGNWLRTTQSGGRIQLMIEFAEINEQTYKLWGRGLAKTRKNGNVARDSVVIESSSHPPWCPASELHKWQDPGLVQLSTLGWGRRRRHPCSTLRRSQDRRRPLASSWKSVLPPFVFSLWGDPEDRWLLLRLWQNWSFLSLSVSIHFWIQSKVPLSFNYHMLCKSIYFTIEFWLTYVDSVVVVF